MAAVNTPIPWYSSSLILSDGGRLNLPKCITVIPKRIHKPFPERTQKATLLILDRLIGDKPQRRNSGETSSASSELPETSGLIISVVVFADSVAHTIKTPNSALYVNENAILGTSISRKEITPFPNKNCCAVIKSITSSKLMNHKTTK